MYNRKSDLLRKVAFFVVGKVLCKPRNVSAAGVCWVLSLGMVRTIP